MKSPITKAIQKIKQKFGCTYIGDMAYKDQRFYLFNDREHPSTIALDAQQLLDPAESHRKIEDVRAKYRSKSDRSPDAIKAEQSNSLKCAAVEVNPAAPDKKECDGNKI